jgi:hypothetical protein
MIHGTDFYRMILEEKGISHRMRSEPVCNNSRRAVQLYLKCSLYSWNLEYMRCELMLVTNPPPATVNKVGSVGIM